MTPGHLKSLMGNAEGRVRVILLVLSALSLTGAVAAVSGHQTASGEALVRTPLQYTLPERYQADPAEAARLEALNDATPPNPDRIVPAKPFILLSNATGSSALSAADCLTAAIYYEAGYEPLDGQRAVAQVVLNRVRHPAFPGSVCAVVFDGAARATGCQFTFTCDGSLMRPPTADGWRRSQAVAIAALSGHVETSVGHATHYHANYVRPYWADRLVKLHSIGAHIFYLWPGTAGVPQAFAQKYTGQEILPTSAATSLSRHLLAAPAGSAYDNMFTGSRPDEATSGHEPALIQPAPGAASVDAAIVSIDETMIEKRGQLRVTQGQLKEDLAAPRPLFDAPGSAPAPN